LGKKASRIGINEVDANGETALYKATEAQNLQVLEQLINFKVMSNTSKCRQTALLRHILLELYVVKADVNAADFYGRTPLHKVRVALAVLVAALCFHAKRVGFCRLWRWLEKISLSF